MIVFWMGVFLGWGAAIPVGPVNLEITRRHLASGWGCGVVFGMGACVADLTYLVGLSLGWLVFIAEPAVLQWIGLIGAALLCYFGGAAVRSTQPNLAPTGLIRTALWRQWLSGYSMTLFNPFTILFWASLSSQLSLWSGEQASALWLSGLGVLAGTTSWVLFLNGVLTCCHHRISERTMRWLNIVGGGIVIAFGLYGFYHSFSIWV